MILEVRIGEQNQGKNMTYNDAEKIIRDIRIHTAVSFNMARQYVAFMDSMNKKAGGFLRMLRKTDYAAINDRAIEIHKKFEMFREKVMSLVDGNMEMPLAEVLCEYVEALCIATEFTKQKTDMMLQLSKIPGSVKFTDFTEIGKKEQDALVCCQLTGDKLTGLFYL